MHYLLGLIIGVGLSAACGFRVFVPLLVMSIASLSGHITLAPGFDWIGSYAALTAFAVATLLEVGGYFVPWLDNVLDVAATPAAIIAATILTASQMGDASPLMRWSLAIIAGGGVCGVVQGGTVAVRALSTGTTGGLGNFAVSAVELVMAVCIAILAITLPILCIVAVVGVLGFSISKIHELLTRRNASRVAVEGNV